VREDLMDEPLPPDTERLRAVVSGVRAPSSLRARVEADRERLAFRRAIRRRIQLTAPLAGAAALAGILIAVLAPSQGAPSVFDAAAVAARPPLAAAAPPDPSNPAMLKAGVGGVHFPTWGPQEHWEATGMRRDDVGGRATHTMFYDNPGGARLGYTIVDGDALPWPEGGRRVTRKGVEIHLARHGSRTVAVWRVGGHTCVLSAPASVPADRLVELASISTYG
jgi:hypothetical protein